jgi:hypothetical protein
MRSSSIVKARFKACFKAFLIAAALAASASPLFAQSGSSQMTPQSQQTQMNEVAAAAQRDFAQFVQHNVQTRSGTLPIGFPLDVADVQDLKDARITFGFPIYSIDPKDIVAGRSDFSAMAKPTGTWRFFVSLNDRPIGLATVERVDGRWAIVAYGAAVLSKDVDALMRNYGNPDRSNLRFIRVYQAQSDFLEVASTNGGNARFAPLQSARESLLLRQLTNNAKASEGASSSGLLDAGDFAEPLRAAVKANMAVER